jgi:hypothetical protein
MVAVPRFGRLGSLLFDDSIVACKRGLANCRCLGWIEAPQITVAAIAAWLAVGGGIALWPSWHSKSQEAHESGGQKRASSIPLRMAWWIFAGTCLFWGWQILFNRANYDEYKGVHGPLLLVIASPLIAIGIVAGLRGFMKPCMTLTEEPSTPNPHPGHLW